MLERHGRTQSGRRRVAPRQAPVADGEYNYAFKLMERRRPTYIGARIAEYKQKLSLCNSAQVQPTLQQLKLAQSLARSAAMRAAFEGEKISAKGRQTLAKALGHGTRRTCIARSSPAVDHARKGSIDFAAKRKGSSIVWTARAKLHPSPFSILGKARPSAKVSGSPSAHPRYSRTSRAPNLR